MYTGGGARVAAASAIADVAGVADECGRHGVLRSHDQSGTDTESSGYNRVIMYLVLVALILLGVIIWRLLRLESQLRAQRGVIEELHQRVWQLEDLVALLHQNRESNQSPPS